MKTALDTNILSTIWSAQPMEAVVRTALNQVKRDGSLVISPMVYAEGLAHPNLSEEGIQRFLSISAISIDLPVMVAVWVEAGRRYGKYAVRRRKSGSDPPRRIFADFLIGAHALLQADCLMTLDEQHYRNYFPELRLCSLEC